MERKESEEKNLRLNQELARIQQELTSIKKIHNELATEYQELAIRISGESNTSFYHPRVLWSNCYDK